MSLPTGTVGVVLAEMAGLTRLREDHGEVMAVVVARLDEIVDAAGAAHDGVRPAKQGDGDSFAVVFARVSDAIGFAFDVQRATKAEAWPDEIALRVRMAIHAGEATLRDDANYLGSTMNRAGRLRAIAADGQTVVSGAAADLAGRRLPHDATLVDLGTHRLRDLGRPERIFELKHPEIDEEHPPLRSLDVVPNNLPAQLTSFVGRGDELRQVRRLLAAHRLVTVTGPGGAGKTRLSLHAAAEASDDFDDGVWFVDLAAVTDPDLVAQAIADAIGAVQSGGLSTLRAIVHHLKGRSALVLVDNCEHVVAAAAVVIDRLLRSCPGLTVLATSREPVGVDGEVTWRIPTLSLPKDDDACPSLITSEAVQLFIERALATRPNFSVTNDNAAAVTQICARLDGIPLAIELAAARVRVLSPAQIAAGLDDRFRLLGAGPRTALPRQATLAASVDWSVDLLDDAERCLLARLAVFAGSFDLDAVEAVCAAPPLSQPRVLDLLDVLVQKSLVVATDDERATRYRLLETIRQYARARLAPDELEILRCAHAAHFVRLSEEHASEMGDLARRLAKADDDYPNVRLALAYVVETRDIELGLRFVNACTDYWLERGLVIEGTRWLDAILAIDGGPDGARARALWARSMMLGYGANFGFLEVAREGRDLARAAGDKATEALAVSMLAFGASHRSTSADACELVDEAIETVREVDDPYAAAYARLFIGYVLPNVGRMREACEILGEALEIQRTTQAVSEYSLLLTLSLPEAFVGDFDLALAHAARGRDIALETGSPYWAAIGELHTAITLALRGDAPGAAASHARAGELSADFADLVAGLQVVAWGALIASMTGDVPLMTSLGETAVALGTDRHLARVETIGHIALCHARRLAGDLPGALEHVNAAQGVVFGHRSLAAARVHRAADDPAASLDEAHAALDAVAGAEAIAMVPEILDLLGGVLIDVEDDEDAVRLLAAAAVERERRRSRPWPISDADRAADLTRARQRMGDEPFDRAWAEGADLDLEASVAYARRGRGKRNRPSVGWASLTPVERHVVALVADGLTNDQVAEKLFVSRNTVRTHLRNVFAKLNVTSRTELAAAAYKHEGRR